jgi:hypothetical protein
MPISFKLAGGKAGLKKPKALSEHFQITSIKSEILVYKLSQQKKSSLYVHIAMKLDFFNLYN